MPSSNPLNAFRQYCHNWDPKTVRCPTCYEQTTFKDYRTRHAEVEHSRSIKYECVFCTVGFKWRHGEKSSPRVSSHLLDCVKRFTATVKMEERASNRSTASTPDETVSTVCTECLEFDSGDHRRNLHGREFIPDLEAIGFYDDLLPDPEFFRGQLRFDEESGLGSTAPLLLRLMEEGRWKFVHVFVKSYAYERFASVVISLRDKVRIAPYWCLCDGYKVCDRLDDVERLHRHMIVLTTEPAVFKVFWDGIVVRREAGGNCKGSRWIRTPFHLATVIVYVSSRKSSCDGRMVRNMPMDETRSRHFYINRPVSPHALVSLCALFSTGLTSWLTRKVGSRSVDGYDYSRVRDDRGVRHYQLETRRLNLPIRGCPPPLANGFKVSDTDGEWEWHLMCGVTKRVRFDPDAPAESREDRFARMVASGTAFVECIESFPYRFTKTQAFQAGAIDRVKENLRLEKIREVEAVREVMRKKVDEMQESMDDLTRRLREAETELREAKWQLERAAYEAKIKELETEVEKLKRVRDDLLARVASTS